MFANTFLSYLNQTLNQMADGIASETGIDYNVSISLNNSFNAKSKDEICCNLVCGDDSKIDGAKESSFMPFNLHIWGEHNTNGKYTKNLFDKFFSIYSMKSVTIIDDDVTYSCFLNFTNAQYLQNDECEGGYRAKFALVGSVTYSTTNEVGRNTWIAFPTSTSTETSVTWYEIDPISPSNSFNHNNEPQQVAGGLLIIPGIPGKSGSIHLVAKNDDVTSKFFACIYGSAIIYNIWLKIQYTDYTYVLKKLIVDSIEESFDDTSRHTVLTITYRKDDMNGI